MKLRNTKPSFRCVLHGSFSKYWNAIRRTHRIFTEAGIEVLAPREAEIVSSVEGFTFLKGEENKDPRMIELLYLHNLKRLGENGFSYFVDPEGYIGKSTSYELGIAQTTNIKCFFLDTPRDHPAYIHKNAIWKPENLANFIREKGELPEPQIEPDKKKIHKLWEDLMVPGSVIAVGGIIEYKSDRKEREVLLVKTHKWQGQYSIVGGKLRRNERLKDALLREVKEETGLDGMVRRHLCTFDQIKNSGYYLPGIQHIFVDNTVSVRSKKVRLNEEAEEYIWMPARIALSRLSIEPNARHTLQLYVDSFSSN